MTTLTLQPDESTGIDTYITQWDAPMNYGIAPVMMIGQQGNNRGRGLIKFDISSLPAGATINSATLRLYCTAEIITSDITMWVRRALTVWYEGNKNGTLQDGGVDGSSWNLRNTIGGVQWSSNTAGGLAGTDFPNTDESTVVVTGPGAYFDLNVTASVQAWYGGSATNYGLWLGTNSIETNAAKSFATSSDATAAFRPQLIIDYTPSGDVSATVTAAASITAHLAGYRNGSATVTGSGSVQAHIRSNLMMSATVTGVGSVQATIDSRDNRDLSATIVGTGSVSARMITEALHIRAPYVRNPAPLLYLTDGNERFDLLNRLSGFVLQKWKPAIAQYKGGGLWTGSPMASGRSLTLYRFDNAIEVMEFTASGKDQDELIGMSSELLRWQQAAADYWANRWGTSPVALVSRAAFEAHERYAAIYMMSCPELENIYSPPFFVAPNRAPGVTTFEALTLRIERGHWQDVMPGTSTCVPISAIRSWTVAGWS